MQYIKFSTCGNQHLTLSTCVSPILLRKTFKTCYDSYGTGRQGYGENRLRLPMVVKLKRPERKTFTKVEIIYLDFYVSFEGRLFVIIRSLTQDVFKGREETVLNFNFHPFPISGIGQIKCSKLIDAIVVWELKREALYRCRRVTTR